VASPGRNESCWSNGSLFILLLALSCPGPVRQIEALHRPVRCPWRSHQSYRNHRRSCTVLHGRARASGVDWESSERLCRQHIRLQEHVWGHGVMHCQRASAEAGTGQRQTQRRVTRHVGAVGASTTQHPCSKQQRAVDKNSHLRCECTWVPRWHPSGALIHILYTILHTLYLEDLTFSLTTSGTAALMHASDPLTQHTLTQHSSNTDYGREGKSNSKRVGQTKRDEGV
jgi:hypothetical protein